MLKSLGICYSVDETSESAGMTMSSRYLRCVEMLSALCATMSLACQTGSAMATELPHEYAARLLEKAQPAQVTFSDGSKKWTGQTIVVGKLDNGVIIVKDSSLALDTDGASASIRGCDRTSQPDTALTDSKGSP